MNYLKTLLFLCTAAMMAGGCAPKLFMVGHEINGDHFIRKSVRPAGSADEQQLSHYYVEICDIAKSGQAEGCNTTLVLENITGFTYN